jgi:hypothetical protein
MRTTTIVIRSEDNHPKLLELYDAHLKRQEGFQVTCISSGDVFKDIEDFKKLIPETTPNWEQWEDILDYVETNL